MHKEDQNKNCLPLPFPSFQYSGDGFKHLLDRAWAYLEDNLFICFIILHPFFGSSIRKKLESKFEPYHSDIILCGVATSLCFLENVVKLVCVVIVVWSVG